MNEAEREVLEKYSTPGLKRNQMDRAAKKDHLERLGFKEPRLTEMLDELFGPESAPTT